MHSHAVLVNTTQLHCSCKVRSLQNSDEYLCVLSIYGMLGMIYRFSIVARLD